MDMLRIYIKTCVIIFVLCFFSSYLSGQDIYINLLANNNGIELTLIPENAETFIAGLKAGYQIRRIKLDSEKEERIQSNLTVRSVDWFEKNKFELNGLVYPLGQIIYNDKILGTNLDFGKKQIKKYTSLVYEANKSFNVATILGLGFKDSSLFENQNYRYEVQLNIDNNDPVAFIDFQYLPGNKFKVLKSSNRQSFKITTPDFLPISDNSSLFAKISELKAISKYAENTVKLRWIMNNVDDWIKNVEKGFQISRYSAENEVFEKDSSIILDTVFCSLFFNNENQPDSLILVAKKILDRIYFLSSQEQDINSIHEKNTLYGFLMLIADQSFALSKLLGLGFLDLGVKENNYYKYRITPLHIDFKKYSITTEVIGQQVNSQKQIMVTTDSLDQKIVLKWSKDNKFSGYKIEKSSNKNSLYSSLTNTPFLNTVSPSPSDSIFSFTDSIPQNYKPYYYRVSGVDAFGDWSEPVEVVGMGIDLTPPPPPVMILAQATLEGVIQLKWEMPERPEDLKYFHVLLSDHLDGEYAEVASRLPVTAREYVYQGPLNTMRSYYFRLSAEDDKGNRSTTLSYYVHLVDSIAPASPEKLEYRVDSSGIVTLVWEHGDEPDLLGYRVYVANNPNHEFAQLTKEPTPLNAWLDTLNLGLLDKEIYYRVVAEDRSHNLSPFSEILPVKRPDIIPPAAPVLLPIASDLEGIRLRWSPSPSNDLAGYILLRKIEQDSVYYPVRLIGADTTSWHDTTALPEVLYEYSVQAMDQSGLLSELSFPLKGRRMLDLSLLGVERLLLTYNTKDTLAELQWTFRPNSGAIPKDSGYLFYLYKKKDPGGWSKIKQFDTDISGYKDPDIKQPGKYAYAIKVVRLDGRSGVLTESGWIEVVEQKK